MDTSKMEGLDDFEKQLAAEKAERENAEKRSKDKDRDRKHRHHSSRHHRSRHESDEEDGHRHKRSRHAKDDDSREHRHRHRDDDREKHRRHRDDSREHKSRHRDGSRERKHRHRDESREHRHRHRDHRDSKVSDPKGDLPIPNDESPDPETLDKAPKETLKRDDWMTAPSALDIDYTQRGSKNPLTSAPPPSKPDYDLKVHKNELNHHLQDLLDGKDLQEVADKPAQHEVDYTFGDAGSQWRMTKLKAVYTQAEQSGRDVDDVALERFGNLRDFDDAREEQTELERRAVYGEGYVGKEKPSGELFQERKMQMGIRRDHEAAETAAREAEELPQGQLVQDPQPSTSTVKLDQSALNRLKAQMMKTKLKKSPDAARLEDEYNSALATFANQKEPDVIVLGAMESRMLAGTRGEVKAITNKRGRERGLVEENEDMSIEDMVREERRTKGQAGGEGQRFAERIAKDAKFDNDLEYMDDNAQKLAKRVQKSEINLKNTAISEFQKMNRILDNCQLCHHEDRNEAPVAPLLSLGTRVYLTLPTEPELSEGGAVIVPIQHRKNLLECDDDEWEEMRNFMKCLARMYHDQGRSIIFYENAATPHRHLHAAMVAVPLPYALGDTASAFFKEAMLSADEEWTQHKKIIDTARMAREGAGKQAFRRAVAKEMPYFHVWTELDGGLGHIVEDSGRWPRGDLFAREIIGGMLDSEPDVIKRQGRWRRDDGRIEGFRKRWRKFDWTRVLTDAA